ncbi:MAG: ABC transporter ATP-binding protein [Candidatus Omnitrophica bacterium]|jgi:ABC-type dipeptide/oligopeptide/nickel transport system ATPase component|nr:ABC transporter ATP-binding protein [Candidatus Omnitrophota bacterium]
MNEILLKVENLHTSFFTDTGEVKAVRGVSLSLEEGKTLGLVGESGCGKTVTALSIMQLLPYNAKITAGSILYKAKDLLKLSHEELRKIRGGEISMIFQEPMTALNPVFTIGEQIRETIVLHRNFNNKQATDRVIELLGDVGIPEPYKRIKDYPHQLSGGMRQRVLIAMALASSPSLLIADEPTTALDVTVQAQILELISDLQNKKQIAMILITHDLGVVAEHVDFVAVMYAGIIVEYATTQNLFSEPLHPYTKALLSSIPKLEDKDVKLSTLQGSVPKFSQLPKGCIFYERCAERDSECKEMQPELIEVKNGHWVACVRQN